MAAGATTGGVRYHAEVFQTHLGIVVFLMEDEMSLPRCQLRVPAACRHPAMRVWYELTWGVDRQERRHDLHIFDILLLR